MFLLHTLDANERQLDVNAAECRDPSITVPNHDTHTHTAWTRLSPAFVFSFMIVLLPPHRTLCILLLLVLLLLSEGWAAWIISSAASWRKWRISSAATSFWGGLCHLHPVCWLMDGRHGRGSKFKRKWADVGNLCTFLISRQFQKVASLSKFNSSSLLKWQQLFLELSTVSHGLLQRVSRSCLRNWSWTDRPADIWAEVYDNQQEAARRTQTRFMV